MKTMTNKGYLIQIRQLIDGLIERNLPFKFETIYDGYKVTVYCMDEEDNEYDGKYSWDAICHFGSYGHEEGLLEIMGEIVRNDDDDVEGYLTANEILDRLQTREGVQPLPSLCSRPGAMGRRAGCLSFISGLFIFCLQNVYKKVIDGFPHLCYT